MEFGFIKTKQKKKNILQALSSNFINIVLLKKIVVELVKKKINQSIPAYGPSLWRLGEFNKQNLKKKQKKTKKKGTENNVKEKKVWGNHFTICSLHKLYHCAPLFTFTPAPSQFSIFVFDRRTQIS